MSSGRTKGTTISQRMPQSLAQRCRRPDAAAAPSRGTLAAMLPTRDLRIEFFRPLLSPAILLEELPPTEASSATVGRGRDEVARILRGEDDRLVVVVGPCSVHDPAAGLDYGRRLAELARSSPPTSAS